MCSLHADRGFVSSLGDGEEETVRDGPSLCDRLGQPSLFRWGKLRPREESGPGLGYSQVAWGPCAG